MAILRRKEIRDMRPEARMKNLKELRLELSRQKALIAAGGALENPGKVREIRRTIARLITIMKELGELP